VLLNDLLVGLYNGFFSLGMIIGPLASSYITLATNFRLCSDIEALTLGFFGFVYVAFIVIPTRLRPKRKMRKRSENNSMQKIETHKLELEEDLLNARAKSMPEILQFSVDSPKEDVPEPTTLMIDGKSLETEEDEAGAA
jgi:MFS family permease